MKKTESLLRSIEVEKYGEAIVKNSFSIFIKRIMIFYQKKADPSANPPIPANATRKLLVRATYPG